MPDNHAFERLVAADLRDSLGEKSLFSRRIIVLESTRSTNDFLRQMLTPALPEGAIVFAEQQTSGRGQRANQWESAPRLGLWFSFLLRPQLPLAESARLTNWAAHAVVTTLKENFSLEARIVPPNDVYFDERKVCGVLVETTPISGSAFAAIIGIGLNVNHALEDFSPALRERAGSIALALGGKIDRTKVAVALLRELERTHATALFLSTAAPNVSS